MIHSLVSSIFFLSFCGERLKKPVIYKFLSRIKFTLRIEFLRVTGITTFLQGVGSLKFFSTPLEVNSSLISEIALPLTLSIE